MNSKKVVTKPKSSNKPFLSPQPNIKAGLHTPNIHQNLDALPSPISPRPKQQNIKKIATTKDMANNLKLLKQPEFFSSGESSLVGSDIQREDLLLLQIKQLKRQNAFLKKKLQQMTSQYQTYNPKKKKLSKGKGYSQQNVESLQLNVSYFFKQINNLLNSVQKLFKLTIKQEQKQIISKLTPDLNSYQCPLQKQFLFKKYVLTRKLQRIVLQDDHKKYSSLLQLFYEYYQYKQQAEHKIMSSLDSMIEKTNQLNKWLLEKAQIKRMKSQVNSNSQRESINQEKPFTFQFLRPSQNHGGNRMTFSPSTKHTHTYRRNTDLSP